MAAGVFRVTQIDLDETEGVSAVHAVADDATADVVRALAGGGSLTIAGRAGHGSELARISMPKATFLAVLHASGKIPGDDPLYRPGLNNSLFRVYAGLIEDSEGYV